MGNRLFKAFSISFIMAILIDENTRVLVQGITGKEGMKAAKEMAAYGTKVIAGVTPGKGGETVEGVPVYDSVSSALAEHKEINTSVIYVPASGVKDAAIESIMNGIKLINIIAEHIPVQDTAFIYALAKKYNCIIVGPNSVGIISPGKAKLGSIGGSNPQNSYSQGDVGLISKSGGMCSEISLMLTKQGLGQSTVVSVGGDVITGSTFEDLLVRFENDKQTKVICLFGEIGGLYEERAADLIKNKKITKPVIAFISGMFAEEMQKITGTKSLGHAGAIIEGNKGTWTSKVNALKNSGVTVVKVPDEFANAVKKLLRYQ